MKDIQQIIGRFLFWGVIGSCLLLGIGGILYLIQHANMNVNYHDFHPEHLVLTDFPLLINEALQFSAIAWIKLGLYFLFLAQFLRVGIAAGLFFKIRDYRFVLISLLILIFMFATLINSNFQ